MPNLLAMLIHSFKFVFIHKPRAISMIYTPYLKFNSFAVKRWSFWYRSIDRFLVGITPTRSTLKSSQSGGFTALFTNMRTLKFKRRLFAAVNHNYDHKQRTLKHRNTQNGSKSTNHKSQTMTFWTRLSKVLFPKRSVKMIDGSENAIVRWILNFRIRMFVKSAVNMRTNHEITILK